jgi:hypothetical protein
MNTNLKGKKAIFTRHLSLFYEPMFKKLDTFPKGVEYPQTRMDIGTKGKGVDFCGGTRGFYKEFP